MVEFLRMREPYQKASEGNWKAFEEYFTNLKEEDRSSYLVFPMTIANDSALHLSVHSGRRRPLETLLGYVERPMEVKNLYESTVLHEAAVNRNIEAVKLILIKYGDEPLSTKNKFGETPLFTAAAFGSTEVVKYLASRPNQMTDDGKQLKEIHRIRADGGGTSILYVAIRGQHFETALELLRLDESLAGLKNKKGMTGLQLLAGMPSAFKSGYHMDLWRLLLYTYLPVGGDHVEAADNDKVDYRDLESGQSKTCGHRRFSLNLCTGLLGRIRNEKRKHKFAFELAKKLIKTDTTWLSDGQQSEVEGPKEQTIAEEHEDTWEDHGHSGPDSHNKSTSSSSLGIGTRSQVPSPILLAAASGIMEIVKEIIQFCPQAVAHVNSKNQNILHVAAMHRQKEVFRVLDWVKVPMHSRLAQEFDEDGFTILHHVADMVHYSGGTRPGPAYQLQEELQWFKRVEEIMPSHYTLFKDEIHRKTSEDLFEETHQKQLKEAQDYIKMTAQACSTVAVLIATVVYAAAYTIPGGNNQHGRPLFEKSSAFALFTVTDYIAVGCSLTSVVMFLSILVAPLQLRDFHHTIPRTLSMGFTFLFLSVAGTMIAFTSTVFLTIHNLEQRRWFRTFCFSLVSVIVSIFAMIQFPLYVSFKETWISIIKLPKKVLKCVKLWKPL